MKPKGLRFFYIFLSLMKFLGNQTKGKQIDIPEKFANLGTWEHWPSSLCSNKPTLLLHTKPISFSQDKKHEKSYS